MKKDEEIQEIIRSCDLKHVAIIMDGNRRWAKSKNMPPVFGHKKGVDSLRTIVRACGEFGIKYLTVYAFSTENFNRKPDEVKYLMELLEQTLKNELADMHKNNVKLKFIGNKAELNPNLREILEKSEHTTENNTGVNLQIALNYGAREEIVHAIREIAATGDIGSITEETVSNHLYTRDVPDPDLLIRTGGEMRISNYLLWQIAYTEIIVLPQYWPDFDKKSFAECIINYKERNRRFGV